MRLQNNRVGAVISPQRRKLGILLVAGTLLLLLGCALTIPFIYETQTLWYKFGIDKTFLRAGKMVGLAAAVLLFYQVLLAARIGFLERLFGLTGLHLLHRYNGILLAFCITIHVALILIPEGLNNLPIGKKYWPEMVGGILLLVISILVFGALLRKVLRFRYTLWRSIHRLLGYLTLLLLGIHVLFVSEAFTQPVPRYGLLILFATVVAVITITKIGWWGKARKKG